MWKASNAWNAAEIWGAAHQVAVAVIVLVLGLLLGAIPAAFATYNLGFYEGSSISDTNWRKGFNMKLKSAVDEQLAAKCGEITEQLNTNCQRTTRALETRLSDKTQEVAQLHGEIQNLSRRSDILETHDLLTESATSILKQLESARAKRDRDAEAAGRARFFTLLSAIRRTNQIYAAWSGLFDSKATELAQRRDNKENISTDDVIGYLQGFTSDLGMKKKVIQNQVDEANKISHNKL